MQATGPLGAGVLPGSCGGRAELTAHVSCHYPGVERAFVDPDEWGRTGVHPVAEVRLPARTPGAETVALRVPLTQHC